MPTGLPPMTGGTGLPPMNGSQSMGSTGLPPMPSAQQAGQQAYSLANKNIANPQKLVDMSGKPDNPGTPLNMGAQFAAKQQTIKYDPTAFGNAQTNVLKDYNSMMDGVSHNGQTSLGELSGLLPQIYKKQNTSKDPIQKEMYGMIAENLQKRIDSESQPPQPTLGDRLMDAVGAGASNLMQGGQNIIQGAQEMGPGGPYANPQATLKVLGGAGQMAATPVMAAGGFLKPELQNSIEGYKQAFDSIPKNVSQPVTEKMRQVWNAIPDNVKSSAGDAFWALGLSEAAPFAEGAAKEAGGALESAKSSMEAKAAAEQSAKLTEGIMPKLTPKEQEIAISEGRVTSGKESALFGKQPDIVTPSEEIKKASETIGRIMPKDVSDYAKTGDIFKLHDSLDSKITETAKNLQPEMQKTPVNDNVRSSIRDAWEKTKAAQADSMDFAREPSLMKTQQKFQATIDDLSSAVKDKSGKFRGKTMDDLWNARKEYDDSIKPNIKNANENSDPFLLAQKEVWLENRKVLNDAIHDTSTGLGKTSKQAFSDMSDLYEAKGNIEKGSKIDLKGSEGLLTAKNLVKGGLGVLGLKGAASFIK